MTMYICLVCDEEIDAEIDPGIAGVCEDCYESHLNVEDLADAAGLFILHTGCRDAFSLHKNDRRYLVLAHD